MSGRSVKGGNSSSANPVFEKWLTEWRDDAAARELQSRFTYNKCLTSLRKYPLPVQTGKECIILEGFGDKICKMIDEKLATFLNEGGVLHAESDSENDEYQHQVHHSSSQLPETSTQSSKVSSRMPRRNSTPPKKPTKRSKSKTMTTEVFVDEEENSDPKKKKKTSADGNKTKRVGKEYMPEFRSGAYAILVTLFHFEAENEDRKYMLKNEVIQDAQKHCDSSFKSTDPHSHYTAWNSMSTLVKKEYVVKQNKLPARYHLTDSGRALASKLVYGTNDNDKSSETSETKDESDNEVATAGTKEPVIEPLHERDTNQDCDRYIDEVRVEFDLVDQVPDIPECIELNDSDDDKDERLDDIIIGESKKSKTPTVVISSRSNSDADLLLDNALPDLNDYSEPIKTSFKSCSSLLPPPPSVKSLTKSSSSQKLLKPSSDKETTNLTKTTNESTTQQIVQPSSMFKMRPNSFEIILFVDNCEQSHAKRQELLIDELKKSSVKYEFGKLNVGDFAWLARSRLLDQDLILDCIVERKRMDDLCQSIIDGRYKEQKFRLKKSGINKIVYLIEDFGSMKHMSLPEKSILQADINTQLIDELVVHHCTDPKDSAAYLIQMTNYLTEKYKNLTLNACPKSDIDQLKTKGSASSSSSGESYLMTFQEFNQFSNKNKPLTIREMFAKCLMKIQGISQEKCLAIVDVYPTPALLFQAYSRCSDESSRNKLLANLKYGSQQRNLGPAISKLIAQLFYTNSPLT